MATPLTISLWIAQGLLAAMFLMAGIMKLKGPDAYRDQTGLTNLSDGLVRFIGTSEVLGGVGIVLPQLIGILPWLTPLAAAGLAAVMALATGTHLRRKEWKPSATTAILMGVAVFVAVGRWNLFEGTA